MGCTADHVNVDDKELEELSGKPTSASTAVGYYRDMENNATIIVTDGSWNSITYGDSGESLVNLAQGAEVTAEGLSEKETEKRQIIVDGKYIESLRFGKSEDAAVTIDLKKQAEINRILVNGAELMPKAIRWKHRRMERRGIPFLKKRMAAAEQTRLHSIN